MKSISKIGIALLTILFLLTSSEVDAKCCKPKTKPARQLTILLTADDSPNDFNLALWSELVARGHTVYAFLPANGASSEGAAIEAGSYVFEAFDETNYPNFYLVYPSPYANCDPSAGECVTLATTWMHLNNIPFDLIISGPNVGFNLGPTPIASGTVSAALMGLSSYSIQQPLPAIAISLDSHASVERLNLSTCFVGNLINYLDTHRNKCDQLLPPYTGLSINIPALDYTSFYNSCLTDIEEPPLKGVVLTKTGTFEEQGNFNGFFEIFSFPDFEVNGLIDGVTPIGPIYGASNFLNPEAFPNGFTGELVMADPFNANTPLVNDVTGKIVLVQRGGCAAGTKAQNVANAGGIGMVVASSSLVSFTSFFPQDPEIPSVTITNTDAAPIITALQGGSTVTLTLTYWAEPDDSIVYWWNFGSANRGKCDTDTYSDTNACNDFYIAISPIAVDYTFGASKNLKKLCKLLKPVLTKGPGLCKNNNKTSPLLTCPTRKGTGVSIERTKAVDSTPKPDYITPNQKEVYSKPNMPIA